MFGLFATKRRRALVTFTVHSFVTLEIVIVVEGLSGQRWDLGTTLIKVQLFFFKNFPVKIISFCRDINEDVQASILESFLLEFSEQNWFE